MAYWRRLGVIPFCAAIADIDDSPAALD